MSKPHYALVLSPVMDTIARSRKTRELWAASFIFSRMMYQLLATRPASLTVIAPAFDPQRKHISGAGLYHDRGILRQEGTGQVDVNAWLDRAYSALATEINSTPTTVKERIRVDVLKTSDTGKGVFIHRINRLLDNLELRPVYVPREHGKTLVQLLDEKIQSLYKLGYEKGDSPFIVLADGSFRLPSLPEIGLEELKNHEDETIQNTYRKAVELPFDRKIEVLKALSGRGKDLGKKLKQLVEQGDLPPEYLEDSQIVNELFLTYLKEQLTQATGRKDIIRFRHKYVAVVQLDGDGLGKAISRLSEDDADGKKFEAFSQRLITYADAAVKMVTAYGGLPVYAGGDDLLFLAPVAMPNADGATNVLSLCADLDRTFRTTMKDETLALSGGVFVSYYKFPLGEAVARVNTLEKYHAKKFGAYFQADKPAEGSTQDWKPRHAKNAITLEVRKHSGQTFGTTFRLGAPAFPALEKLLAFGPDLDDAFLTAATHRLQSSPVLLADVARTVINQRQHSPQNGADVPDRLAAYRKHQFGKGGPKHEGEYLTKVLEYAVALFDPNSYGDALPPSRQEALEKELEKSKRTLPPLDYALTNHLFAALRFKQFLIMSDHD